MKRNTKIFEGLFDKFNKESVSHEDILYPIKKEIQRFLSSRQKSLGQNMTCLASDYGVPEEIWEKRSDNLDQLKVTLMQRIQQLDPRCKNLKCDIVFADSTIKIQLSLDATPPWTRAPVKFIMLRTQLNHSSAYTACQIHRGRVNYD